MVGNKTVKGIVARLLVCAMVVSAAFTGIGSMSAVNAASVSDEMKTGDMVSMGTASELYQGEPNWKVLDVADENNDGINDRALLISEKLWSKNGTDANKFNNMGTDTDMKWDGSLAKEWCASFYTDILNESELVADTSFNDPAVGNFRDDASEGNKVFYLGYADIEKYFGSTSSAYVARDINGNAKDWWLRSAGKVVNRFGTVNSTGYRGNTMCISNVPLIRPAFNLDLSGDMCASAAESDGVKTWTIDVEKPGHQYGEATYTWTEDKSKCRAEVVCGNCGASVAEDATITEEVTTPATEDAEGIKTYTAVFANAIFTTQTETSPIPKLDKPVKPAAPTVENGQKKVVNGSTFKVLSTKAKTVSLVKAKNVKSYTVPATVKIANKTYKVITVESKALTASRIRTVTIGKNVKTLKKYSFSKCKAKTVIVKSKLLKKAAVKGSLKGSKVSTVKVSVGSKSVNKKYVKAYKKIFTKANAGRKVTVK